MLTDHEVRRGFMNRCGRRKPVFQGEVTKLRSLAGEKGFKHPWKWPLTQQYT